MSNGLGKTPQHSIIQEPDNFTNIRNEMRHKIDYEKPYYANRYTVKKVITDFNEFPYNRWYRGQAESEYPIIIERENGYRLVKPNLDEEHKNNIKFSRRAHKESELKSNLNYPRSQDVFSEYYDTPKKEDKPIVPQNAPKDPKTPSAVNNLVIPSPSPSCFESACSTVYPCKGNLKAYDYKEDKISIKKSDITISP